MKTSNQLKTLSAAIMLLVGSQAAHALTPWTNPTDPVNGTILKVYVSGGAAQDLAFAKTVEKKLAQPGTLHVFQDASNNWAGYYFIAKNDIGLANADQYVYLEKRSRGAAGYGVVPLGANGGAGLDLDHLDIFKPGAAVSAAWPTFTAATASAPATYQQTISAGNASTYLTSRKSDGGFIGVDYKALLKAGTENYPNQSVTELTTGLTADSANTYWDNVIPDDIANNYTIVPTGGLVYGVGVTLDLYKVLQAAQGKTVGSYTEANLPSLSRNFIAALLSGKIAKWSDVKLASGASLTSLVGTGAGQVNVTAPSDYRVAVGRRNKGAAIGAVAYAKLLNYPEVEGAFAPAADSNAQPLVKSPGGSGATGDLLHDWQNGLNVSLLNPGTAKKYWGIAVNSGDRNADVSAAGVTGPKGKDWRYVKIDNAAPTIGNVAAGSYPYWAEGQVLVSNALGADATALLITFGQNLGSVATALEVNPTVHQAWGDTGIFATTQTDSTASVQIPFNAANPVVGLTHVNGSESLLGIVPRPFNNGAVAGGNIIELK